MEAKLVAIAGPLKGSSIPLERDRVSLGRDPKNEIAIDDRSLSRLHCEIFRDGAGFQIKDLGSANQTYVNSLPVREQPLAHGDEIRAGRSIFLFLHGADEPPSSAETEDALSPGQSTVVLRPEDARYLHPGKIAAPAGDSGRIGRDLRALLHAAEAIASLRGLDELAPRILELLGEAIPAGYGAVLLSQSGDNEWHREFWWRRNPADRQPLRVSRGLLRRVCEERVSLRSNDVTSGGDVPLSNSLISSRVRSVLCVPLVVFDQVLGAIYLGSSDSAVQFDQENLELLAGFAGVTAGPLSNALRIDQLESENRRLQAEISIDHNMIGESPRLLKVYDFIRKVAPSESTALINGESGTGKELVARAIHRNSRRSGRPFIAINCAALNENLLESELFGHEKGAFTGAVSQKKGKIEEAAGGTLFLDEVGELAPGLQAKLLRVLQEREFERVGSTKTIKADIRLIAATNRDLKEASDAGAFRRDLYFRLNVVSIVLPSLRDRREDIPRLVEHFLSKHAGKTPRRVTDCSAEAMACLKAYDWPGNVRELENAVERAVVLGSTLEIQPDDLPDAVVEAGEETCGPGAKFHETIRDVKRQLVQKALEEARYSYADAARQLGLHPNNLHRLMKNLGIKSPGKGR